MENIDTVKDHLRTHITYPASKHDILTACDNMDGESDEAGKEELATKLPEQTFNSADEVISALGW